MRLTNSFGGTIAILLLPLSSCTTEKDEKPVTPPNILIAISDDQSWPDASAYGSKMVNTPAFDRVANEGILFTNAFVASPGCAPSRAAMLTGLNCWQIKEAGTHGSRFPLDYKVYPDVLEEAGYYIGYTNKGWGPGDWEVSGRKRNPAGNVHNIFALEPPTSGIVITDYAANFIDFIEKRPEGKPFYFWYGSSEPHRIFEKGSGIQVGKDPESVLVPGFLPDTPEIRDDLLDYALEIEWFDEHLGRMIEYLEKIGELDNTIIVVTSDNGMAFPRAKANLYEHGIHVPLAVRWGNHVQGSRVVDDLVSLIDLAPTFLEVAGVKHEVQQVLEGRSLFNILKSNKDGRVDPSRDAVFASRERHSSSRWNNLGYPQRCVRTHQFLYIRNFKSERWPAGAPRKYDDDGNLLENHLAYHDIDECPTQDYLVENREDPGVAEFFEMAVGKRPTEEFFDIQNDPYCLTNLANDPQYHDELNDHRRKLGAYLMETNDPRVTGNGDIFETYPRLRGVIREFPVPEWAENKTEDYRVQ